LLPTLAHNATLVNFSDELDVCSGIRASADLQAQKPRSAVSVFNGGRGTTRFVERTDERTDAKPHCRGAVYVGFLTRPLAASAGNVCTGQVRTIRLVLRASCQPATEPGDQGSLAGCPGPGAGTRAPQRPQSHRSTEMGYLSSSGDRMWWGPSCG